MTPAERQQRRRQRLNARPARRLPWDDSVPANAVQARFIDELYRWIASGDAVEVAPWLAFAARGAVRWDELDEIVRQELQEKRDVEFRDY